MAVFFPTVQLCRREGDQTCYARPLNHVQAVDEGLGFDEVDEQAPGEIAGHEGTENNAVRVWPAVPAIECDGEEEEEEEFVELRGVARDAVAEVDAPGQRG